MLSTKSDEKKEKNSHQWCDKYDDGKSSYALLSAVDKYALLASYEEQEKNSHPGMFRAHTGVLAHHLARLAVNNDDEEEEEEEDCSYQSSCVCGVWQEGGQFVYVRIMLWEKNMYQRGYTNKGKRGRVVGGWRLVTSSSRP